MDEKLEVFYKALEESFECGAFVKCLLSKYRGDEADLQRLTIRPVVLRKQPMLSFVYSYKTRTITKNFEPVTGLKLIESLLGNDFKAAHFQSADEELQLTFSKKGKLSMSKHKPQLNEVVSQQHNREKKRFVDMSRPFLSALKVTDQQQKVIPAMSRKWKQINKFIEIFSQAIEQSQQLKNKPINVVDFGSGKGYLTFAMHDYLQHSLSNNAHVTGVELREELAGLCNKVAKDLEYTGLDFVCGDVQTHAPEKTDVMIALHACDTATDYAIHYGIRAKASIIMCSPCCHKQIRPQMQSPELFKPMLQYGVHLGQQAEMVTDSLRALLLEANGYSTKVFEFVSLEHTNKNKMILAVKKSKPSDNRELLKQIAEIKAYYGIKEHCLEELLRD